MGIEKIELMVKPLNIRKYPGRKWAGALFIILVLLSIFLLVSGSHSYPVSAFGLAIMWAGLIPTVIWLWVEQCQTAPILPMTGIFYSVFFGLPVFTSAIAWPAGTPIVLYSRATLETVSWHPIAIVLVGLVIFITAFYISRSQLRQRVSRFKLPSSNQLHDQRFLIWILFAGHISYAFLERQWTVASLGQFFAPAGYVALGGLLILALRKKLNRTELILLFGIAIPLEIYDRTRLLFLTDVILLCGFITLILLRLRKNRSVMCVGIIAALTLSFFGATTAIRGGFSPGIERIYAITQGFYQQMVVGSDNWTSEGQTSARRFEGRFGSLIKRTSHLWMFHIVDNKSPKEVPYWAGKTYSALPTSFIPRLIYPEKPTEEVGYHFGQRYGFLHPIYQNRDIYPELEVSSVNLPWITELLANFGRSGVLWGMALIGIFMAFLDRLFNDPECSDLEFVIGVSIIFPLAYPESNFSVMTGSILPLFVGLYAYFALGSWLLVKYRQHPRQP